MKLLGVDYGLRRIGLAISEGILASPLGVAKDLPSVVRIATAQGIDKVVIGLPDPNNDKIKLFGTRLAQLTGLPVEYTDETLSTRIARKQMIVSGTTPKTRRTEIDQNAAAVILQSYLDQRTEGLPL